MKRKIPKFASEDEESKFWSESEKSTLPGLKPSTRKISLRLPQSMIDELKLLANKRDVPYQSLLKIYLAEKIDQELHPHPGVTPRS